MEIKRNTIIYFLNIFSETNSLKLTIDKLLKKYDKNVINDIIVYCYNNGLISKIHDYYINTKGHYFIQYIDKEVHITQYGYNLLAYCL